MSSPANFIRSLRILGQRDLGKVAILRRSLGGDPGDDVRAFPMVEPHLPTEYPWDRQVYYLIAGLWASVNTASVIAAAGDAPENDDEPAEGNAPPPETPPQPLTERGRQDRRSFGRAVAQLYRQRNETESIERRFIALLDADETQLAHYLRQMIQLVRAEEGIRIHWAELLTDLRNWNRDDRRVQQRWARAFYRDTFTAADADDTPEAQALQATNEGA